LEQVLASYRVPARVQGGTVTPRLIRFQLLPAPGTRISAILRLSEELAMALGASSIRVRRRDGQLEVEVPRDDPTPVTLRAVLKLVDEIPPTTAILGLDEDGAPLLLRLASPEVAHVLICGTTGSGKTALARTMILSLARGHSLRELGLVLIDPQGRGYRPLADLPHLARPLATTPEEAESLLAWLVDVMEQRAVESTTTPRLVCFVDELADLMLSGGQQIEAHLTRLVQRGRSVGIHVVACTQKPTAAIIGSLVKSNFPVRLVGSVPSPEDAKVATGLKQTGAERLLGRGDFLLVVKGHVYRFQAAYVPPGEIREMVAQLRGRQAERRWSALRRVK
jgi:S-DNA-T family DNA segregation ATPase FtsK/SpoIIIE